MASGPRYNVDLRRRREGVTDYRQRLRLLKSGRPRLVARVSNRHVRAHLEQVGEAGDETVAYATSADLESYGWEAPTGNLPSAYLTGLLLGRRALEAGVEAAVLDIGLHSPTPGAKVFAVQEGAIDAGMDIPHNDAVLPDWSRNRGEHIAAIAQQADGDLYDGTFDATDLPEHFDEVRERIMEDEQ
ncbi:MAG: 50S ribosomal protein L18 [Halobacteriota archaeon]